MITTARTQVTRFRIAQQYLDRRQPRSMLVQIAAGGVQDTPPGSAALAFGARLTGLTTEDIEAALASDKSLIQLWSVRAAPYLVPTSDAGVFTAGLLPDDEASRSFYLRGARHHLRLFEMTATEIVERTAAATLVVLDGRALTKDELGVALAEEVARTLPGSRLGQWNEPDGLGRNTYGESLVRYALAIVGLQGLICLAPRQGRAAIRIMRTDQWLGRVMPQPDAPTMRAELVRRYLRWFGPSTVADFAGWAGVSLVYARASWDLVNDELERVDYNGRLRWILKTDETLLREPPSIAGVRWLPPHDPYLALQDKATLVPDRTLHQRVWRSTGSPGAVLLDGEVVAIWRPSTKGKRLAITVEPLSPLPLPEQARRELEREASLVAWLRGLPSVEIHFD